MPATKIRGKSAILVNNTPTAQTLLKIESVVPKIGCRNSKLAKRSHSTLSSALVKKLNESRRNVQLANGNDEKNSTGYGVSWMQTQNGICRIRRTDQDKLKLPDRINLDRRGLTMIPFIENEPNLRLLSLQHNLINIFHVPQDTIEEEKKLETSTDVPETNKNHLNKSHIQPSAQHPQPPSQTQTSATGGPTAGKLVPRQQLHLTQRPVRSFMPTNPTPLINSMKSSIGISYTNSTTGFTSPNPVTPLVQKSILLTVNQKNILKRSNSFMAPALASGTLLATEENRPGSAVAISDTFPVSKTNIPPMPDTVDMNGFSLSLQNLVFLDLYDNQIDKITNLDGLRSLTVLLLGKNRIHDISGIVSLRNTLRVLDLHGNKISSIAQKICRLQELKSLNLAGNQLRHVSANDFSGLFNLKELNLKRNRIKRISGFDDLRSLERLWLCHNDLQRVEEMSCIAKAINLKEVTIENNPVSLAGDCVSFLVSYLPCLISLSQMQVTEQVRRAAMAWRKNKETSDSNYVSISSDVGQSIRREEVISNARTNWELLRSQQSNLNRLAKKAVGSSHSTVSSGPKENEIETISSDCTSSKKTSRQKISSIQKKEKKHVRCSSQENSSSTVDVNADDFFRLPPILAPFLDNSYPSQKTSSGSSLGPNIDSCPSYISSDEDGDSHKKLTKNVHRDIRDFPEKGDNLEKEVLTEISKTKNPEQVGSDSPVNSDIVNTALPAQVIELTGDEPITKSTETSNVLETPSPEIKSPPDDTDKSPISDDVNQSDSKSNLSTTSFKSDTSMMSNSSDDHRATKLKSANPPRKYFQGTSIRAQTAKNSCLMSASTASCASNLSNNSAKSHKVQSDREREQGGDYLIEICGRYLNVYGVGALKFIDKQWNVQKANDVHTVKFSYVNFNNISTILNKVKIRFPNAENFIFRETNINCLGQLNALAEIQGINSLIIDPEGNGICSKNWRSYAIYRLSHWGLKQINGTDVTPDEVSTAELAYSGLSDLVLWSLPESLLTPLLTRLRLDETCLASKKSAKEWLMQADASLKSVVGKEALQWRRNNTSFQEETAVRQKGRLYFSIMMENTCNAVEKLHRLEQLWPAMLVDMIRSTLIDYSQIENYVRNIMNDILKNP
uniref:Dynein axonemal assembly factor 1 homolog n=1 Tax=Lutzomyia longipalpis TaxID=7200 RepID=A0A1B0CGV2_LUTLO